MKRRTDLNVISGERAGCMDRVLERKPMRAYGVTEDQVREAFSLIAAEWSVGEN